MKSRKITTIFRLFDHTIIENIIGQQLGKHIAFNVLKTYRYRF